LLLRYSRYLGYKKTNLNADNSKIYFGIDPNQTFALRAHYEIFPLTGFHLKYHSASRLIL